MPWPIPQPTDIFNRAAAVYTGLFPSFEPTAPNTVGGANCRIVAMSGFDLYLYQGYIMNELFPDTTEDNLDHHASIWGLTRIPAQAATGPFVWPSTTGATLPAGIVLTDPSGNAYLTTSGGTVAASSTITVTISAVSAGAQGNLAAGTVLTPVSPDSGMATSGTVGSGGLSGGSVAEGDDALRARLLQRIRQRGRGGNAADYTFWAESASSLVAYVQVVPAYVGYGSVGVFIAGVGPSALGGGVVAAVGASIAAVAPVPLILGTSLLVASASTEPIIGTVHLVPDTPTNRTMATNAWNSYVASAAEIGGTIYLDLLAGAIAAGAAGAFAFDLSFPTADVVLTAGTIAVPGTLSFA